MLAIENAEDVITAILVRAAVALGKAAPIADTTAVSPESYVNKDRFFRDLLPQSLRDLLFVQDDLGINAIFNGDLLDFSKDHAVNRLDSLGGYSFDNAVHNAARKVVVIHIILLSIKCHFPFLCASF